MRRALAFAAAIAAFAVWSEDAVPLWSGGKVPRMAELKRLEGVEFSVIKRHEPEKDGYHFLHGVALCWHKGKLYASYGTNKGLENTSSEETHVRASADGGKTWSDIEVVSSDGGPGLGISHGSLAELNGELWCFSGAFSNLQAATHTIAFTHTRAYVLDDATGRWRPRGMVVGQGFWPMQNPIRMPDGNWIMGGLRVASGWNLPGGARPAAAISHGDDFTRWDVSVVQNGEVPGGIWGEATVDMRGMSVTLTVRPGWKEDPPVAHVATSADGGRTWTPLRPTNLPAASSKPFTGILSTGQRYFISQTTADGGRGRTPLTIAVGRPGEWSYSHVFLIRPSVFTEGPGPSPARALAYPSAVEHEGRLYVAYSNSGSGGNQSNSAELAIIPVSALRLPAADGTPDTVGFANGGVNTVPGDGQIATRRFVRFEGHGRTGGLLCVGSSYAWHGPNTEKLGWSGDWGMAASAREKDCVHVLGDAVRRIRPDAPLCIVQSATWERNYTGDVELLEREYKDVKEFRPDWICIITTTANAPRSLAEAEPLDEHYAKMVDWFRQTNPNARIVLSAGSSGPKFAKAIKGFAKARGYPVVDFNAFINLPGMRATGLFEHAGVASHPSDRGMAEMGRRYAAALGLPQAANAPQR